MGDQDSTRSTTLVAELGEVEPDVAELGYRVRLVHTGVDELHLGDLPVVVEVVGHELLRQHVSAGGRLEGLTALLHDLHVERAVEGVAGRAGQRTETVDPRPPGISELQPRMGRLELRRGRAPELAQLRLEGR